jgi:hypothetical protein
MNPSPAPSGNFLEREDVMDIGSYLIGIFSGLAIAGVVFAYWYGEERKGAARSKESR